MAGEVSRMDIASSEDKSEREYFASWIRRNRRDPAVVQWVPQVRIFRYTDLFEDAWGWDRLLPRRSVPLAMYLEYLKEYHKRNRMDYVAAAAGGGNSKPEEWPLRSRAVNNDAQFDPNGSLVDAAQFCLDMEGRFMSAWKNRRVSNVKHLSHMIQERARLIINGKSQEFSETAAASLVCIANEAVLASELLDRGARATDEEILLCNLIRHCALSFMDMAEGPESAAAISAMVGVAKEARIMCERMREAKQLNDIRSYHPPSHKMHLGEAIRVPAFKVMRHLLMNSTTGDNNYMAMDFDKKKKKKRPKGPDAETSNEELLQGQLSERDKYIVELERKLSDRDRELGALKFEHKMHLLRAQKDLAKARSVCDTCEAERAQHQQIVHYNQECLQEKVNQLLALEEQHKVAQDKLRRAHSLIARVGEICRLHCQSLEAELRECTDQFGPNHTTTDSASVLGSRSSNSIPTDEVKLVAN